MAPHTYNTSVIQAGTAISFGANEDISVGPDALIGSTNGDGIDCTGSLHNVSIAGAVSSDQIGIALGSDRALDTGQVLSIAAGATIDSGSTSVVIKGSASSLDNNGVLTGFDGVVIDGDAATGRSTLTNNGIIRTEGTFTFAQAISREGTEDFLLVNNGLIKALATSYSGFLSTGEQTITNNGKMVGGIQLGEGNDVYNGQNGLVVHGDVRGGAGDDHFAGGKGADSFIGGAGHDILTGGKGADHFVYLVADETTVAQSGRDLITDFRQPQHDKVDLSNIHARGVDGDDPFDFIGRLAFHGHEGELRSFFKGGDTFIAGDTDGDKSADFEIELTGHVDLHRGDFIL
jgi:hypothetical protein